ncbi:MAG: cytochrome c3 family protein [Novosphingobium sp.]
MMRRWGLWLLIAGLAGVIVFTFAWPQVMVAPGPVIPAHSEITGNCFACHAPLRGASAERCTACHKLADIGVRTTKGVPVISNGTRVAFHQALSEASCMACHSDHTGPLLLKAAHRRFAHTLLRSDMRVQCAACHSAPATPFHAQAGSNCAACHSSKAWMPATFDHTRYFALTGPHQAACTTCHIGGSTSRYTCFGCHQHQPDQIRASHAEEGIQSISNCAACHRSGSGEGGEGREGGGEGGRDD